MKISNLHLNFKMRNGIDIVDLSKRWFESGDAVFIPWDSWPMVRDVIDRERKLRFPALTPEDYAEESHRKAIEIHYHPQMDSSRH